MDDEEELRVGSDRVPDRRVRLLGLALLALIGVAAVWLAVRSDDDGAPVARPTSAVSSFVQSSTTGVSSPVTPSAEALPSATFYRCPVTCQFTSDAPAGVVRALRGAYPGARVGAVSSVIVDDGKRLTLLRRTIKAVAGARYLSIVITPFVLGPDDVDRENSGTTSRVTVESTGSGASVRLVLTEPRTPRPDDLTVLRLARDPRLAALR